MKTIIIKSKKDSSSKLLIEIAKKMGMKARVLTDEEMEDIVLGKLIDEAAADTEEVGEEEGLKILRSYGFKV